MSLSYLETHFGKDSPTIINAMACTLIKLTEEGFDEGFERIAKIVEEKIREAKQSYPIKLWKEQWAQGKPFIRDTDEFGQPIVIEETKRVNVYYDEMSDRYTLRIELDTISPQFTAWGVSDTLLDIIFYEEEITLGIAVKDILGSDGWEFGEDESFGREDIITDNASEPILRLLRLSGFFEYWKGKKAGEIIDTLKNAMSVVVLSADLDSL